MGKKYKLKYQGQTDSVCELTSACNQQTVPTEYDVREKTAEEEQGADADTGGTCMEPGVKPGEKGDPFRSFRYTKQTLLVGIYVCMGLTAEIAGPTLPDLTERLCVNYEEISRALMGRSIGVALGTVVAGFLSEIFYNHVDLLLAISLFLMGIACTILPLVDSLLFVAFMLMLNGFGEGIIDTGGNTMVMHLWGESAAPYMHVLHFGFGLGALLAPQIARPFLSPEHEDENYTVCDEAYWINGTKPDSESRIEIPYAIIGIFTVLFSFIVLAFYIRGPPTGFPIRIPNKSLKTLLSVSSCSPGYSGFGIGLLTLLFLYFIQAVGGERAYGSFLFSFAVEAPVQFSKDEASYLQSAFWASFTFSRLMGGPIAKFVPLNYMIIGHITGGLVTAIVLAIWGSTVSQVLWVFTCLMGIFIALVFPNGMSWSNLQLLMNSMAVMLLLLGGSVGGFLYPGIHVTGSLFENVGPETLMYIMVAYGVVLAVLYAIMEIVATYHDRNVSIVVKEMEVVAKDE